MKILAVDTATKSCSVAVADPGNLLAEITFVSRETHSRHLMEMVRSALDMARLSVADLDGFAVTIGPGTFTGLRIGISSVKGMAAATEKPVAGISSLEALARQIPDTPYTVCPILDARRGEVYSAAYRYEKGTLARIGPEQVGSLEDILSGCREDRIFVGTGIGVYRQTIQSMLGNHAHFAVDNANDVRASTVAAIGIERLTSNCADDLASLIPNYIRKSDAEINLENKLKAAGNGGPVV